MFGQILSGASGALSAVNNFASSNAATLGMAGGIFDMVSAAKQAKLNEKVYRLQKKLAYHGIEIRTKDLKAAGLNPILAAGSVGAASGNITAPSVGMDVGGKLNNAMAFAQQAAALRNANAQTRAIEAQTESQELDNQNKQNMSDYQNGKYDSILNNPYRLALDDLSSGYRDLDSIYADFDRDVRSGLMSKGMADSYKELLRLHDTSNKRNNIISKKTKHIPLAVRRQYELDRLSIASNKTAVEQQILQNVLSSYNARTLPNETNQQILNNLLPWLSNAQNWLPYLTKALKHLKKGVGK